MMEKFRETADLSLWELMDSQQIARELTWE